MRSLPSERKFIKIIPLIDIEIFPWVSQIFELLVVQDVRGFLSWEQSTAKGKNTQTNKKTKTSPTIYWKYWAVMPLSYTLYRQHC